MNSPATAAAATAPLLAAENLRKSFGGNSVLDGVSLAAAAGQLLFILGPSACGKTTLLRVLAGALEPDSGTLALNGNPLTSLPRHARKIAFLTQRDTLWPHLTLRENIEFQIEQNEPMTPSSDGSDAADVEPPEERRERVRAAAQALLSRLSLDALAARRTSELAASERRRAALARALATEPKILLLDEPFDALDDTARRHAWELIRAHCRDNHATAICVTQRISDALTHADYAAVLATGTIHQCAPPIELYRRPQTRLCGEFLSNANVIEGKIRFSGAGEFVATTPIGEIRGALADPAATPPEGTPIDILIRPETLHLDTYPPEEDAFPGKIISPSDFTGSQATLHFQTQNTILSFQEFNPHAADRTSAQTHLWATPEDITGILRKP